MSMPMLIVTITWNGSVCVLSVSGELDICTARALEEEAAAVVPYLTGPLIIDLAGLEFTDSHGARTLAAVGRAAPPNCPVIMRRPQPQVRRILDLLQIPLEQLGDLVRDRARWLVLESQVLCSWAGELCTDSDDLLAAARKTRARHVSD